MERRFNEENVTYSISDNVFWKGEYFSDELFWHYDHLEDVKASSIGELLDKLSTKLHMNGRQYEWSVDCLEPKLWVRYKDENKEEVCGAMSIDANIPDEEIIDNLVACGKEHGLDVME
jgi:hypothetical protein